MVRPFTASVLGGAIGLCAGGLLFALALRASSHPLACPARWTPATAPSVARAQPLLACRADDASGGVPFLALYRTEDPADAAADRVLTTAGAATGVFATDAVPPPDAPSRDVPVDAPALEVASRTGSRDAPLDAEVYFIAAGRRFGLLSVVHTARSAFAAPRATAAWMDTITGTSPWGSDDAGAVTAQCPAGFDPQAPGPDAIVRCATGVGTDGFTALTLSVNEGGFGREEDRARVADALARRVVQAQGAHATLVAGPEPFTLARHADAIHAAVRTGETVPITTRAVGVYTATGDAHVVGFGAGQGEQVPLTPLRLLFQAGGFFRRPWLVPAGAAGLAVAFGAAGALAGALLARRKGRVRAEQGPRASGVAGGAAADEHGRHGLDRARRSRSVLPRVPAATSRDTTAHTATAAVHARRDRARRSTRPAQTGPLRRHTPERHGPCASAACARAEKAAWVLAPIARARRRPGAAACAMQPPAAPEEACANEPAPGREPRPRPRRASAQRTQEEEHSMLRYFASAAVGWVACAAGVSACAGHNPKVPDAGHDAAADGGTPLVDAAAPDAGREASTGLDADDDAGCGLPAGQTRLASNGTTVCAPHDATLDIGGDCCDQSTGICYVPTASDLGCSSASFPDASMAADVPMSGTCPPGQGVCPTTPFLNESSSQFRCRALVNNACPAADLIPVRPYLIDDTGGNLLHMSIEVFPPESGDVLEDCVHGGGVHRLLRFNYASVNIGTDQFNVGRPNEADPLHWMWSTVHNHWHINAWADFQLRTLAGAEVGHGHKQSFCLEDNIRIDDQAGPRSFPPPLCENFDPTLPYDQRPEFGLSIGWGDEYPGDLRCQYVDLGPSTPDAAGYLPDGIYQLAVTANQLSDGTRLYRESNYDNNSASVRVQITATTAVGCADTAGDACEGGSVGCDGTCGP